MKLENTEDFLRKFDYNYERHDKKLIVNMEYSQKVLVNFSNPEKMELTNKLTGWNFLTGVFTMSIKNAVIFNLIGGFIISCMIALYDLKSSIFFFLGILFWVLVWFTFYHSKFDTLKQFIIKWQN